MTSREIREQREEYIEMQKRASSRARGYTRRLRRRARRRSSRPRGES